MRSATGTHNQELVSAPDQGAGSSGPPETESLTVGRPLGSIQHKSPPNCKFFIWLALLDQCWIGETQCHHMQDDDTCAPCSHVEGQLCPSVDNCLAEWRLSSTKKMARDTRKGFDSLVVMVWWYVWNEQNNMVFHGAMQQVAELSSWIREEASMWALADMVFHGLTILVGLV
jgi:hypothetical protein